MSALIRRCLFWIFTSGTLWGALELLGGFSLREGIMLIFDKLWQLSMIHPGPALMIFAAISLILNTLLERIGIYDAFSEKIDKIGGFNKFRITPRFINYTNFEHGKPIYFTVVVQVKNIGNNISKITDWSLEFIDQDKKRFFGSPLYQQGEIKVTSANDSTPLAFTEEKALYTHYISRCEQWRA